MVAGGARDRLHSAVPPTPAAASPADQRALALASLATTRFDLLVVGGGITGAGVARDAALRGLRVALVEARDFASGTSSRSSRLVHGGVRYLEHGHVHLVFESSRERRLLLRLAPHLVRPLRFTWPVYRGARVPRWKLVAGLMLYDALALFRNVAAHRPLTAAGVLEREPALDADGLVGGASYWDAETDDSRLTLATALDAAAAGAVVLNHAAVERLAREDGRCTGAVVRDRLTGEAITVAARVVVNATGPWSDELRRLDEPDARAGVRGTKGVHILVPRARLGNEAALTLLSPVDGRVMFALPAGRFAVVGTTDTPTDEHPAEVRATEADVAYLLAAANAFFPLARLGRGDVISAWAGIRPLAAGTFGEGAASASREHTIARSASGVITVTGGKLTTYRAMAAEVVDAAADALGLARTPAPTDARPLPGGDFASLDAELAAAGDACGDTATARRLVYAHGARWREVWALAQADRALAAPLVPGLPYVRAELAWSVRHERACTLGDLLVRRTHVAFETPDAGRAAARAAAGVVAPLLGWDAARVESELAAYDAEADRIFRVTP